MSDAVDKVLADLDEQEQQDSRSTFDPWQPSSPTVRRRRSSGSKYGSSRRTSFGSAAVNLQMQSMDAGGKMEADVIEMISPSDAGDTDAYYEYDDDADSSSIDQTELRMEDFDGEGSVVEDFEDIALGGDRSSPEREPKDSEDAANDDSSASQGKTGFRRRLSLSLKSLRTSSSSLEQAGSEMNSSGTVDSTTVTSSEEIAQIQGSDQQKDSPFFNVPATQSPFDIQMHDGFAPSHNVIAPILTRKSRVMKLEQTVSFTRQRTLPPKDPKEDQRHMKEYKQMMKASQEKGAAELQFLQVYLWIM